MELATRFLEDVPGESYFPSGQGVPARQPGALENGEDRKGSTCFQMMSCDGTRQSRNVSGNTLWDSQQEPQ